MNVACRIDSLTLSLPFPSTQKEFRQSKNDCMRRSSFQAKTSIINNFANEFISTLSKNHTSAVPTTSSLSLRRVCTIILYDYNIY